jgi:hypothetical protein
MAKVLCIMPTETDTKVNIKMRKEMAKVFTTLPIKTNTRVNLKMVK